MSEEKIILSNPSIVAVTISPKTREEAAGNEAVNLISGVKTKVKRSRTFEKTVSIQWGASAEIEVEAGVAKVISGAVQTEIERVEGKEYKASVTSEHEVELDGDKGNRYVLTWIDTWREGVIEMKENDETYFIPFEFREKTELTISR